MKINILIFPAGTEIAFEIFNALKYSKFVKIFGGTSVSDHSKFVFDNLIDNLPFINDKNFIEEINKIINRYNIKYIYPAHDSVCMFLSEHAKEIDAEVVGSEYNTVKICRSKEETYRYFEGEEFIPRYYSNINSVDKYPVFVKPKVGQGSQGAERIDSRTKLINALDVNSDLIICEYLEGEEYTVDCFTDKNSVLRVIKLRNRERIRTGISVRSKELFLDDDIKKIANIINDRLSFRGAWFFQVKKNRNNEYRLMEISPRIPGTMGVSRNLGINFPLLSLFDLWGYDIDIVCNDYEIVVDKAFYSAYSIGMEYKYIYLDFDDTLIIDGKVNDVMMQYIYQSINKGKQIILLTKHNGNIYKSLAQYKISELIFNEVIVIDKTEEKIDYISKFPSIFIDDSFFERSKVHREIGIPVFDVDMIESLIDWKR